MLCRYTKPPENEKGLKGVPDEYKHRDLLEDLSLFSHKNYQKMPNEWFLRVESQLMPLISSESTLSVHSFYDSRELVLLLTLYRQGKKFSASPEGIHLSLDIEHLGGQKNKKDERKLEEFLEHAYQLLQDLLAGEKYDNLNWERISDGIYYRVSREDVELALQAEKLLKGGE